MSCERDEALNAMVDGQLGAEALAELEAHLALCEACRVRRDGLEGLRRDLEGAFAPESRFAGGLAERIALGYERPARPRPWGWVAAAAAALLALGLLVFRKEAPSTIVRVPVPDKRETAAWQALEAAHAYARQNPTDRDGFRARCENLAKHWPGTEAAQAASRAAASASAHTCVSASELAVPSVEELRRQIAAAAEAGRAREAVDAELVRLDVELNAPLARENFSEARRLLEAARARRPEPRWTEEVGRRAALLEARIGELAGACVAGAQADPASADAWRRRVAAWGVEEPLARFDREVKIEEKKSPEPKGLLCVAAIGDFLVKGPEIRPGERAAPPLFLATRDTALCAFQTEGGDVLRVNALTRLEIPAKGPLRLHEGELFVVAKGAVEIDCGGKTIRAKDATLEVSHRDLTRMVKGPGRSRLRVLAIRGEVRVDDRVVKEGELCAAVNGAFEPSGPEEDVVLATAWTHALLRERPEDAAELGARAAHLAMLLDDPRLGKAAENALRAMGDDAAGPLLGLLNEGKMEMADLRRWATLAADLAGPRRVPEMIDKLGLADATLRAELVRGLRRITGQSFGPSRTAWESWAEKNWR